MRPIIHFGAALHDSKYTRFIVPWWKVSHTWKHGVLYFSLNINIASNIFSVTSWSPYAERVDILMPFWVIQKWRFPIGINYTFWFILTLTSFFTRTVSIVSAFAITLQIQRYDTKFIFHHDIGSILITTALIISSSYPMYNLYYHKQIDFCFPFFLFWHLRLLSFQCFAYIYKKWDNLVWQSVGYVIYRILRKSMLYC